MKLIARTLKQLVPLLPVKAQRFLWFYVVASASLAMLDVAALSLLAISLGAMISAQPIDLPLLGRVSQDGYIWIIASVSLLIIAKSLISLGLQWFATRRFADFELEIGDRLFDAYIRAPWTERLKRSTAELVRLADVGIATTISAFLLPSLTLPTLILTTVAIFGVIIVAQPITAIVTVVYLGGIGLLLSLVVSRKAVQAGRTNRDYSFKVATLMTDMVSALKEITLRNKAGEVAAVVHANRRYTSRSRSNLNFLTSVPKFVLDAALVGGFLLVGGVAFLSGEGGLDAALAAVALFGVAGFRLVPSLTSFQSVMTGTHASYPNVQAVIGDIHAAREYVENAERVGHEPLASEPRELVLKNVGFTYPGSALPSLTGVDLRLPLGSTLALVGASGSGKTTLVDLILGLLVSSSGEVTLDGVPLDRVLAAWRSRVGYVPQDVALFDGTIAQNVALDWDNSYDPELVEQALRRAQLWSVVASRDEGMRSRIGERGLTLSGGQRQRLGIARALYGDPLVLVMDEATSALDTKTEAEVSAAINALRGDVTIVSVAHRLSTIRENDQICFMREGTVVANGTFDELVAQVPDFAEQANLAGLS